MSEERPIEQEVQLLQAKRDDVRRAWRFAAVLMVALVLISVLSTLLWVQSRGDVTKLAKSNDSQISQFEYCAKPTTPKNDPRCQKPVGTPAEKVIQGPQGVQGIQGIQGEPGPPPSDEQVRQAVNAYCANGRCNGKAPTPQQVALAVAQYCNARGQCTPPKPKDGKDGKQGEPGQNATSEQVAAAVASFCADGACDGKDGKNGRSVTISTFPIDGEPPGTRVVVSYSDDTPSVAFNVFDGKDGAPGKVGPQGPAVESWSWTDSQGVTYTCTDPDGDLKYSCTASSPAPTPGTVGSITK